MMSIHIRVCQTVALRPHYRSTIIIIYNRKREREREREGESLESSCSLDDGSSSSSSSSSLTIFPMAGRVGRNNAGSSLRLFIAQSAWAAGYLLPGRGRVSAAIYTRNESKEKEEEEEEEEDRRPPLNWRLQMLALHIRTVHRQHCSCIFFLPFPSQISRGND